MDFALFGAAATQLGVLKNLAEGFVAVRDEAKLQQLRVEMLSSVISLQSTVFKLQQEQVEASEEKRALLQQKAELEASVRRLEERQAARDSKELVQLFVGYFALAQKPATGQPHQPPYYCQACADDGKTIALRHKPATVHSFEEWKCPVEVRHGARNIIRNELPNRLARTDYNPYE